MTPEQALKETREINEKHHYTPTILTQQQVSEQPGEGPLSGLYVTVKDNICVRGIQSTAGSRILDGYEPEIDATAVARLKVAGAKILAKTTMDAFGFGTFNTNTGLDRPVPTNPHDEKRVTGGSSGGAAGMAALAPYEHIALAESTGGSIACPAAWCGVYGLTPTYGRVSRHGLISYADSLDKIGLLAKTPERLPAVLETIAGPDENDSTSLSAPLALDHDEPLRIGLLTDSLERADSEVREAVEAFAQALEEHGHTLEETTLPLAHEHGVAAYYILATAEASTNLARLSGLRYGQEAGKHGKSFTEYFTEIRSEHFNTESKRRIILGTFARMAGYRDAYYEKALRARTRIIGEYKQRFADYDVLLGPTMPSVAPTREETEELTPAQTYAIDVLTAPANLAGLPHISIPLPVDGLPIGAMAVADHLDEKKLFALARAAEENDG